jgi:hypothetical protein
MSGNTAYSLEAFVVRRADHTSGSCTSRREIHVGEFEGRSVHGGHGGSTASDAHPAPHADHPAHHLRSAEPCAEALQVQMSRTQSPGPVPVTRPVQAHASRQPRSICAILSPPAQRRVCCGSRLTPGSLPAPDCSPPGLAIFPLY